MFPEGARFVQDINEVIDMLPEDKYNEFLKSAEITSKRENAGTGIDPLEIYFDDKTYNLVTHLFLGYNSQKVIQNH